MKADTTLIKCSFCKWYPIFKKDTFESIILPIPEKVCNYLEHDAFLLPLEATKSNSKACNSKWSDGSQVKEES